MHDTSHPDHACIFALAAAQMGYFTAVQARECGFRRDLLSHHARSGRFARIRRGLYRLRDYPSTPEEDIMAAWLSIGPDAIVSHESALDLLELGTIIPNSIHLTVPRKRRYTPHLPGVTVHTTTLPIRPADRTTRYGIPVTTPARAIIDAAATYVEPDQVEMSVAQALFQGRTTREELETLAKKRNGYVQRLIGLALARTPAA